MISSAVGMRRRRAARAHGTATAPSSRSRSTSRSAREVAVEARLVDRAHAVLQAADLAHDVVEHALLARDGRQHLGRGPGLRRARRRLGPPRPASRRSAGDRGRRAQASRGGSTDVVHVRRRRALGGAVGLLAVTDQRAELRGACRARRQHLIERRPARARRRCRRRPSRSRACLARARRPGPCSSRSARGPRSR